MEKLKELSLERYEKYKKKYEIGGKIGNGAYGIVTKGYLKNNPSDLVAIKQIHSKINREGEGIPQTVIREINVRFKTI